MTAFTDVKSATSAQIRSMAFAIAEQVENFDGEGEIFGLITQSLIDEEAFHAEYGIPFSEAVHRLAELEGAPLPSDAMAFGSNVSIYPHTVAVGHRDYRPEALAALAKRAQADDVTVIGAWSLRYSWALPQGVEPIEGERISQHPKAQDAVDVLAVGIDGCVVNVQRLANNEMHDHTVEVGEFVFAGQLPAQLLAVARGTTQPQCYACESEVELRPYGGRFEGYTGFSGVWTCYDESRQQCQERADARFSRVEQSERVGVALDALRISTLKMMQSRGIDTSEMEEIFEVMRSVAGEVLEEHFRSVQPCRADRKAQEKAERAARKAARKAGGKRR